MNEEQRPRRRFGFAVWAEAGLAFIRLCGGPVAWMPGASGGVCPHARREDRP